ncbi:MAG: nitroreductase family protein [Clostridia bacterium]|nr:nitroreductase family protein [Clostridia bacterium]
MLKDLVIANRSYRRFDRSVPITETQLRGWIDVARFAASSVNRQILRYRLVTDPDEAAKTFATLGWAGMLPDWPGPAENERPVAYIVMLTDLAVWQPKLRDEGIAAQTILLAAAEDGFAGCMLGNVRRDALAKALGIDQKKYEIGLVLALGKAGETVRLTDLPPDGNTAYYRDENDVHWVPKRSLDEIIVK